MADALLFDTLEGWLDWYDEDGSVTPFYSKLNQTSLLGHSDPDDVMAAAFVALKQYTEAELDPTDKTMFIIVPNPEDDADVVRFKAPDSREAFAWVDGINKLLGGNIPQVDDADEAHDAGFNPTYQGEPDHLTADFGWQQAPSQPHANSSMPAPPATRLQPLLESPYQQPQEQQQAPAVAPSPPPAHRSQYVVGQRHPQAAAQPQSAIVPTQQQQPAVVVAAVAAPPPTTRPPPREPSNVTPSASMTAAATIGGQRQNPPLGTPAIRTYTTTTHDEYRQGGGAADKYDQTNAWVNNTTSGGGAGGGTYDRANSSMSAGQEEGGGGWGERSDASGRYNNSNPAVASGGIRLNASMNGGAMSNAPYQQQLSGKAAVGAGAGGYRAPLGAQDPNTSSAAAAATMGMGGYGGYTTAPPTSGAGGHYNNATNHLPSQSPINPMRDNAYPTNDRYSNTNSNQQQQQGNASYQQMANESYQQTAAENVRRFMAAKMQDRQQQQQSMMMGSGGGGDRGYNGSSADGYDDGIDDNNYPSEQRTMSGTENNNNNASTVLGRKRSGMFINVPSNLQVNRNVAPNVSAMWREWTDVNTGDVYVFHEPTGTLQKREYGSNEFIVFVDGTGDIPESDLVHHPYLQPDDTVCDVNNKVVRNIQNYGTQRFEGAYSAASPDVYRTDPVMTPRGQYSPSRKSRVSALVPAPRQSARAYEGRRVHQLSIGMGPSGDPAEAVITHQVQPLAAEGLLWDPKTGQAVDPTDKSGTNPRNVGQLTLFKQWEHVRQILMQGRYFKKHAVKTSAHSYRFVFLTGDNAYVVCVPTSEVMLNVHTSAVTFESVSETLQYYGRDAKAIAVNNIVRVSLGSEEESVMRRGGSIRPQNTFCIVTRTHAFLLECDTGREARYFADAWNFFLHHSKPLNVQAMRTKEMRNPVTHGTRAGLAF